MRYPKPLSILHETEGIVGKSRLIVLVFAAATLVAGCASAGGPTDVPGLPDFMQGPLPNDGEGTVYGRGSGESTQMRIARSIARSVALGDIAEAMNVQVQNWTRNLDDQMGTAGGTVVQAFIEAQKQVFSGELQGVQERDSRILQDGDTYIVYVLLEQDPGVASAAIMARMREQEAAYARFRQTKVFEEMEEVIARYEQRRGNRQQ